MAKVFTIALFLLVLASLCRLALGDVDFGQCLNSVRNGTFGLDGVLYSNGTQVAEVDLSQATGMTYDLCLRACGHGHEAFSWSIFSLQFTSWFLPWLPLMSQLPYAAKDSLGNFLALLLMVGSPTLAAYSLALAVITNRWMVNRFARSTLPHAHLAAQALGNLQQVSIHVPQEEYILSSLVVLRENADWWQTLARGLDYPVPKWTLAAIMSTSYVLLADTFSWISALGNDLSYWQVKTTGESIGSLWLCILPIVVGYLQISPKSDCDRIKRAFDNANNHFFPAVNSEMPTQGQSSHAFNVERVPRDVVHEDETCSAPVFFYARVFKWLQLARQVTDSFDDRAHQRSRTKSPSSEVTVECMLPDGPGIGHYYEIIGIFLKSAFLALFLQWGTAGAAMMSLYLTPPRGLACRSGTYLLYGCLSTIVWLLSVISSIFAYSYATAQQHGRTAMPAFCFSIFCRHLARILAAINTLWLFTSSLLEFSNLYSTCYCNSCVLSQGARAYSMLTFTAADALTAKHVWVGGMVLSSLTAITFVLVIGILQKRPEAATMSMIKLRTIS